MNSLAQQEVVKAFANHYRIDILQLLEKRPGLDVVEITHELKASYKTIAVHTARLSRSKLIYKRYRGHNVEHRLTKRGKYILKFLRSLE